ncbi:carboxymuconolactone decarboxylase family protein [Chitinophaga sp. HK235]|uniref:carboxymuconolactone decarboxylase family protein n=1 Tax=Chitinophaga sp. HK235 TaxID=2952571 RepID=UPI001BAB7B31|nr:carboxymuconolactone decarboxylase family protein [Chitinophaga sp. HK235]
MEQRMNLAAVQPAAYEALSGLEKYLHTTQLSEIEKGLIKVRASQINHCAYCINMHTVDAVRDGENAQRLFLLDAWRETNLFSEEEKIMLQLTEEITLIHQQGVTAETYNKALTILGEIKLAQVLMAVIAINAWNRLAITAEMGFSVKL